MKNSKFFVRIIIDHVNLCTFLTIKTFNRRKTHWWKRLSNFDLKIKHKFDKKNSADKSSRRQNYEKQIMIENQHVIDRFLKIIIFSKTKNFEILNIWNWILINLKKLFSDDFWCKEQSSEQIKKKTIFDRYFACDSRTDRRKIKKQSVFKNSHFKKCHIRCIKILRHKKSSVWTFDKFKKKKSLITMKKILKKRDKKFFSRSEFQKIDSQSKLYRFVNVENCDELVFRKIIKILTNKDSIFAVASLKLSIVFKILQKTDFFSIKIRFQVLKISKKQNDDDRVDEKNRAFRNSVAIDIVSILKWHIKNDIFCWKNKWYIFSNLLKKKLLKQNHDNFYAKYFDYNKIFDLIKKNISELISTKMSSNMLNFAWHVEKSKQ